MGGLKPIGSEKLEGMDKIKRIMEIARYNENIPHSVMLMLKYVKEGKISIEKVVEKMAVRCFIQRLR